MTQVNKKKVISDSFFLSGLTIISKLKGIIFLPIIIGIVGISYYGIFQQLIVNVLLLFPFFGLGLGNAFHRFTSKLDTEDKEQLSLHWWSVVSYSSLSGIVGTLVLLLLSPLISKYILEGKALDSLYLSSVMVLINVLWTVCISYLQARREFKLFSIVEFIYQFVPYLGFVIGILINKTIFLGILFFIILKFLIYLTIFIRISVKLNLKRPSRSLIQEFLSFSWPLSFSSVAGGMLDKIDRYFIGYFLGNYSLGVYNIIYSCISVIDALSTPFRRYIASYLPKLWDNDEVERVKIQIQEALLYYGVIGFLFVFALMAYLEDFLSVLLNKSFEDTPYLRWTIVSVALGVFLFGANKFFFQYIKLYKATLFQLYIYILGVIFNVILNLVLIPRIGVLGAGLATMVSYLVTFLVSNYYYSLSLTKSFYTKIGFLLLTSTTAYLLGNLLPVVNLWTLILNGLIYCITFIVLLFSFRVLSVDRLKARFL